MVAFGETELQTESGSGRSICYTALFSASGTPLGLSAAEEHRVLYGLLSDALDAFDGAVDGLHGSSRRRVRGSGLAVDRFLPVSPSAWPSYRCSFAAWGGAWLDDAWVDSGVVADAAGSSLVGVVRPARQWPAGGPCALAAASRFGAESLLVCDGGSLPLDACVAPDDGGRVLASVFAPPSDQSEPGCLGVDWGVRPDDSERSHTGIKMSHVAISGGIPEVMLTPLAVSGAMCASPVAECSSPISEPRDSGGILSEMLTPLAERGAMCASLAVSGAMYASPATEYSSSNGELRGSGGIRGEMLTPLAGSGAMSASPKAIHYSTIAEQYASAHDGLERAMQQCGALLVQSHVRGWLVRRVHTARMSSASPKAIHYSAIAERYASARDGLEHAMRQCGALLVQSYVRGWLVRRVHTTHNVLSGSAAQYHDVGGHLSGLQSSGLQLTGTQNEGSQHSDSQPISSQRGNSQLAHTRLESAVRALARGSSI